MKNTVFIFLAACGLLAQGLCAQTTYYVATNGNSVAPYTNSWADAATNIHAAVALATGGDTVLVSNGLYRLTNTIVMTAGFKIQGANGATNTVLDRDPATGGFRLVNLNHASAIIQGFTLSRGSNATMGGGAYIQAGTLSDCVITNCVIGAAGTGGGGIRLDGGVVSNCLIVNCRAPATGVNQQGGGIWMVGGLVMGSTIQACWARYGAGLYASGGTNDNCTIRDCISGYYCGGVYAVGTALLRRCRIFNNVSPLSGGGIYLAGARLENSLVYSNRTILTGDSSGGGVRMASGTIDQCTIANNVMITGSSGGGGGLAQSGGTVRNCIVYANKRDALDDNYAGSAGTIGYSCAPELTTGVNGNVATDPLFKNAANSDYRIQLGSPCMDSGTNLVAVTNDIEMVLRPLAGDNRGIVRHDMGAYEANGSNGALQLGLIADPSVGLDSVTSVLSAVASGTNTAIVWYGWDLTNSGVYNPAFSGQGVVTNTYGPGRYSVALRVTNSVGESASVTRTNMIMVSSLNIFVSTNGSSAFPYASWSTSATNIHDAFAAVIGSGATILVTDGTYRVTGQLTLAKAMTVRSVNGAANTVFDRDPSAGSFGIVNLNHVGAVLQGVTLSRGSNTIWGGGAYIQAGTLRDCVITNCVIDTAGTGGGGIRLDDGVVSNCLIVNCRAPATGINQNGGGIWMVGGLVVDSTIQACWARYGAGLYASGGTNDNCTIRDCTSGYLYGGGYADGANTLLRRCRIFNNTSPLRGGGLYLGGARLENSLVYSNRTTLTGDSAGGGIRLASGTVDQCTIANNVMITGSSGGGGGLAQSGGTVRNCIIYANKRDALDDNYVGSAGTIGYSCAPELTTGVNSNVTTDPLFKNAANFDYRLQLGSPCMDSGTNLVAISNDIDMVFRPLAGDSRGTVRHDMGAYEANGSSGSLQVGLSGNPLLGIDSVASVLTAVVSGTNTTIMWYGWDFTNSGVFNPAGAGLGTVTNTYGPGHYSVALRVTNSIGEYASVTRSNLVTVSSSSIFVSTNGSSTFPFGTWATAATNIHDAFAAVVGNGATILVTDGTYRVTSQLSLANAMTVRSVSGAASTILDRDPAAGSFGIVQLNHTNAILQGFTLSRGSSAVWAGGAYMQLGTMRDCIITNCVISVGGTGGGGIRMDNGVISNCLVVNCRAPATGANQKGGGIWMVGGLVVDSTIQACWARNGGGLYASGGTIDNCTIRDCISGYYYGGAYADGTTLLRRCRIFNNTGDFSGGGIYLGSNARMENSLIYSNRIIGTYSPAAEVGGGVNLAGGTLVNCTLANNSALVAGGGIYQAGGTVTNCIIYNNTTNGLPNDYVGDLAVVKYSCALELTNRANGNTTRDPLFVAAANGNYRLKAASPCINTGTNQSWMFPPLATAIDLDGNKRVFQAVVDMGAYEAAFQGTIFTIR